MVRKKQEVVFLWYIVRNAAPRIPMATLFAHGVGANFNAVPHYEAGGLIAWSIITLLLCTIPGIVALVKATGINKSATVEEQTKKISSCKTWCIVGTVLGILAIIGSVAANS